jgi:ammonia channel protein AmtB
VSFLAALSLILSFGAGSEAYAASSTTMATVASAHNADGCCAPSAAGHHDKAAKHGGTCGLSGCCSGAMCGIASLSPSAGLVAPALMAKLGLSAATAALSGRAIAPPLDPPRPFV